MDSMEDEIRRGLEAEARAEESVTEVISEEVFHEEDEEPSYPKVDVVIKDNVTCEDTEPIKATTETVEPINPKHYPFKTRLNEEEPCDVRVVTPDMEILPSHKSEQIKEVPSHPTGKVAKSIIANAMAFPGMVSSMVDEDYVPLGEVAKELSETIESVQPGNAIIKAISEVKSDEEDDGEMSIEQFNDVPATDISIPDEVLISALQEKHGDVSTEEAMQLIEVMNRYKSGEKFKVFDALPPSLKSAITTEAISAGVNKQTMMEFFAKSFINDLVNNTYLDKEIKDFNEELKEVLAPMNNISGTVMDEYSDEIYHKFTDELEAKADEIQEENPEKADELRAVSKSFKEAISLERVRELITKTPSTINQAYKKARDNWNRFVTDYQESVSAVNPTPRDISYYEHGLNSSTANYGVYNEEYVKTLIVLVADTVVNAVRNNSLTEHIYAYYASNAMYTIGFTANNSEVNEIIMTSIADIMSSIHEYMYPLIMRNSKKNRKRNKGKK